MRKFFCKSGNEQLYVYTYDSADNKKLICVKSEDVIKWIHNFSTFNTFIKVYPKDIEFVCPQKDTSIYIIDYKDILSNKNNKSIQESIDRASLNGYFVMHNSSLLSNPNRGEKAQIIKIAAMMLVLSGISLFSVFPGLSSFKKIDDKKEFSNDTLAGVSKVIRDFTRANGSVEELIVESDAGAIKGDTLATYEDNLEDYIKTPNSLPLDPEKLNDLKDEKRLKQIENVDVDIEREFLLQYFNIRSYDKLDSFLNEFIETMRGYERDYTKEELIDLFYKVANIPLEEKIECVKESFDLDDEKLDSVAATLVGEGYGGGEKYIDVFATTTTAMNHLQYPAWVYDISRERGEELGHNIYGHTCYKYQFNAFDSDLYYRFFGKRDITGFKSVIDTLYLNAVYGLILHDYTQFRGAWIDVPNGKIFEDGGNKYLDKRRPEDRTLPEALQNDKNNSMS